MYLMLFFRSDFWLHSWRYLYSQQNVSTFSGCRNKIPADNPLPESTDSSPALCFHTFCHRINTQLSCQPDKLSTICRDVFSLRMSRVKLLSFLYNWPGSASGTTVRNIRFEIIQRKCHSGITQSAQFLFGCLSILNGCCSVSSRTRCMLYALPAPGTSEWTHAQPAGPAHVHGKPETTRQHGFNLRKPGTAWFRIFFVRGNNRPADSTN